MSEPVTGELVSKLQQEDLRYLLLSDDMFNNIVVITEDDGEIEAQMNKALGVIDGRDGARGICVVIQQPTGDDSRPGIQFGPLDLHWVFLVLEWRQMNADTTKGGTGKKAWTVARRIHRILKSHRSGALTMNFYPSKPSIAPVGASVNVNGMPVPLVAYEVRFTGSEGDNTVYTRVANPSITGSSIVTTSGSMVGTAGDTVTLDCSTSGASIYYTTDLSHPCSQNPNATLYSAPFTSVAGALRVRAHKSGSVGSDTISAQFN